MKSAAEDITLDDLSPTRRRGPPKTTRPPPKVYTPEELRELGRRAREVGKRLHDATEQLNESICTLEDTFLERLGEDARGRVEIHRGETPIYQKKKLVGKKEWVEFLVYRWGEFFVESNKGGTRFTETHILSASREMRVLVCDKFAQLWVECGGRPPKPPPPGV